MADQSMVDIPSVELDWDERRASTHLGDEPNARIVIGRAEGCDVRLDLVQIAREHVEVRRDGRAVVLRDLHTETGTLVNTERLKAGIDVRVKDKDVVEICGPRGPVRRFSMRIQDLGRSVTGHTDARGLTDTHRETIAALVHERPKRCRTSREMRQYLATGDAVELSEKALWARLDSLRAALHIPKSDHGEELRVALFDEALRRGLHNPR